MLTYMTDLQETTVARAEELCTEWAAMNRDRDVRVLLAWRSQMPKSRIAALMGLARSTVDTIIAKEVNSL
jgi:hypothetical protein